MIMPAGLLETIVKRSDWLEPWIKRGMLCVRVPLAEGFKDFELSRGAEIPQGAQLLGCGGWDEDGVLHWVGIDMDVGHGNEKQKYANQDDAIEAAYQIREFVNGAAEIRLSKSGNGVHVRIAITGVETDGRVMARRIALWLAATLEIKCDRTVLGRQNLWFWSKTTVQKSFALVEACGGEWRPPPAALKDPEVKAPQIPPVLEPFWLKKNNTIKRAEAYMRKVEPAISGSFGHNQAFKAACALIRGFALEIDEARPLFYTWNAGNKPPFNEKDCEHKLSEAYGRAKGERGYLLRDNPEAYRPKKPDEEVPKFRASDLVKQQLADEISGKRFAALWPWDLLHRFTLALLPQNVTVLCAPPGVSKSFFMLQAVAFWMQQGYRPAILELEENRTYHLRRVLAQACEDSSITDPEWVKAFPEKAEYYAEQHADFMDQMSACIFVPEKGKDFNTDTALGWLKDMTSDKRRVICIDPVTARDPSEKPWIDDHRFVRRADDILDGSLVMVTHPKNNSDTSLDNLAGGKAFQRFAQVILAMEAIDTRKVNIIGSMGRNECLVNRQIHLRKTRNGKAANACIGFYFNGKNLKFEECGMLPREDD